MGLAVAANQDAPVQLDGPLASSCSWRTMAIAQSITHKASKQPETMEATGCPVAPWAHLVPPFPALARKLRVALPCIGLDGIGNGLKEIRWDGIHISHAFDIDTEFIPALIAVHGRDVAAQFCIGPVAGHLLRLNISTLMDVDMIRQL